MQLKGLLSLIQREILFLETKVNAGGLIEFKCVMHLIKYQNYHFEGSL